MTDSEFYGWLKKGGRRIALLEVDTQPPKRLSTVAYTTTPTDSPPNTVYRPVLAKGFAFTERLELEGGAGLSVGDIELHNEDGKLDSWLEEVWVNRGVRVYIGDPTWPRSEFRQVFSGIAAELTGKSANRLALVLRDKLDRLNTPVTEEVLEGSTSEDILPVLLGECHNITPLLVDEAEHEYQVHTGAIERIIEVRDEGVPVGYSPNEAEGKFRLLAAPAGTITVSAQGHTPYTNTVAGVVKELATKYGDPVSRMTTSDLDEANFNTFNATHPQPVGLYLSDRANVLESCQQVAASLGAQLVPSRAGKLRLVKIAEPVAESAYRIGTEKYEHGSLELLDRTTVLAGVRLGYCKNWTVQQTLDTGVLAKHKELYAQEWLTVSERDSAVAEEYRLFADDPQEDTLLLDKFSAQAEALRRLNLWKVQKTVFSVRGYAELLQLELGQSVVLYGRRFGLQEGRLGVVVALESDWIGGRVTVEVLVNG